LDQTSNAVRIRLSSTVVAVKHDGDPAKAKKVAVWYERGGRLYKVKAKGVVMAGQQHVNRHICRDIDEQCRGAMQTFHHAPILTVNVALRNWRPGDRLRPLSHRNAQKLKRLLNEKHVSRWERNGWPVLTSGGVLAWARGFPVAAEFAADERTRSGMVIAEEQL
ncbi:MAG: tRNA lysidine(34) synthetase TilS, partial [Terriglobales bacterium]